MPSYTLTARVVLHKDDERAKEHSPDAEEYATLHEQMYARGYRRFYESIDGDKFKLPPGEYTIDVTADDGKAARTAAMDKAKAAAKNATSVSRFSVYITGGGNIRGYHLEKISEDPDA
ncbi:hypothetical protein Bsp3421_004801 [Burkholderia sp. FERM BP-3421]|uniref:hypothetical protein n=1 Tax=Burkholderia sp. FERM BP-3421 TaxID=1494466 RepID=UPI002361564C|nr:hypothetical protein [Burkholderia sp. FERM BP-3421]WDD94667.1 hypothetical protein Bsp3421_004801 [Burkholderia sp. FERM BP-3421]